MRNNKGPLFISHASYNHSSAYPIAEALDALDIGVFYLNHPTPWTTYYDSNAPFAPLPSTNRLFGDLLWPAPTTNLDMHLPTTRLQDILFGALERCQALVVIITPHALGSVWVQKEVSYYQHQSQVTRGRPTIGITLAPHQPPRFTLDADLDGRGQSGASIAAMIDRSLRSK